MGLLQLYKDEEGQVLDITIKDTSGEDFALTWIVLADSTIEIKTRDLKTVKSTITSGDMSNTGAILSWTPTTAQIGTDIGVGNFKGFVHLRDNASSREVVAEFDFKVLDN